VISTGGEGPELCHRQVGRRLDPEMSVHDTSYAG